jgi:glycosyltransferase involved in cell wall biosynthesis
VIVPAYNASTTVGQAVDSVLAQTFGDLELIVIDDGSTDPTAEIVRSRRDQRIRCITIGNGGVAGARNLGLDLASGDFVAFLDADDAWLPVKLERQLELIGKQPAAGLCFTSVELVDGGLRRIRQDLASSFMDFTEALLTSGNVVTGSASSAIVRRSLLESVGGFDPQLSQCADWDLWLRLSLATEFGVVNEPLVQITKGPGTMSSDPALLEKDTFALLDKFFTSPASMPYRRLRRRTYGTQWMVCAGTYLHAGQLSESLRCVRRGLLTDPRSLPRPLLFPVRFASRLARERTDGS